MQAQCNILSPAQRWVQRWLSTSSDASVISRYKPGERLSSETKSERADCLCVVFVGCVGLWVRRKAFRLISPVQRWTAHARAQKAVERVRAAEAGAGAEGAAPALEPRQRMMAQTAPVLWCRRVDRCNRASRMHVCRYQTTPPTFSFFFECAKPKLSVEDHSLSCGVLGRGRARRWRRRAWAWR